MSGRLSLNCRYANDCLFPQIGIRLERLVQQLDKMAALFNGDFSRGHTVFKIVPNLLHDFVRVILNIFQGLADRIAADDRIDFVIGLFVERYVHGICIAKQVSAGRPGFPDRRRSA